MKKKLTLLLVILININYFCFAQDQGSNKKIEEIQTAYLTKELSLNPDEASKFFPVYHNYREEIVGVRKANKGGDPIALEEKLLVVRKKYRNDFKGVLGNDDRVSKVFVAEKNFREILRQELMKRKMNQDPDDQE